jgi:hypothetical protein
MHSRRSVSLAAFALLAGASAAQGSTGSGEWFHGRWACTIDGRPSTMVWRIVDDPRTTCSGRICTSTSGVRTAGFFKERTGPWVPLRRVGSSATGLRIVHNEADPWVLNRRGPNLAQGHTTWRGGRYPLSCRRA